MPRSLDKITSELAEVTDALLAVQSDDFRRRHELLTQQDELRAEAGIFKTDLDAQRPTQDVLSELAAARSRRDVQVRRQSGRNLMTGPGGTGGAAAAVSGEMMKLSKQADDAGGLEALIARVSLLESLLAERGIDIEAALEGFAPHVGVLDPQADPA